MKLFKKLKINDYFAFLCLLGFGFLAAPCPMPPEMEKIKA